MDEPLSVWYCDKCGEIITNKNEGYVIWKKDKNRRSYGFCIIHRGDCDTDDSYSSSMELDQLLGDNGREYLLSKLDYGRLSGSDGIERDSLPNMTDFVDLFRRVQTPYYEEARRFFELELIKDDYEDFNEYAPYTSAYLLDIIEKGTNQ